MKRLMLAAVALGLVGTATVAVPASATVKGENGKIAFRRFFNDDHSRGDIFTVGRNGTGVRRVTHTPGGVGTEPDWSPNGRWIVYMIAPDGDQDHARLAKIHPDGTGMTPLSQTCAAGCFSDGFPAWSPSGTRIAFQREVGPAGGEANLFLIDVMRADGSHVRRITQRGVSATRPRRFFDNAPSWAPHGAGIAFERQDNKTGLHAVFTIRLNGHGLHRVTPWGLDASQPDYSPSGGWIMFRSHEGADTQGNVWLVHPDGTGRHPVTHSAPGVAKWLSGSFSPDGRRIVSSKARIVNGAQQHADVYVMNLDGTHMHNVTQTPGLWESAPDWGPRPRRQ
jgi:TolB protein